MIDRYRNYQPRRRRSAPVKKHRVGRYLVLVLIIGFFGGKYIWSSMKKPINTTTSSASTKVKPKPKVTAEPLSSTTWTTLDQRINAVIAENPTLDISVAVIDIKTSTRANYGIQNNFAGASTTKVLTAAAYLHDIEAGKYAMTAEGKNQLRLMINRSDNTAWDTLNRKVGYNNLNIYAQSIGLSSFNWNGNIITASDQAILLEELYRRKLLSEENTTLLLSFMQNTNNEDMIPTVTPAGATLWHKYGQLEDRLHDAAIIEFKQRPLAVVIYTKGGATDGSNYTPRTQLVGRIAQTIFDTMYTP